MDAATAPPSTKPPPSPAAEPPPQHKVASREPSMSGISIPSAIPIKEEDHETSILDCLDTGYESDAPAPALLPETQLELELEKKRYPGASTWAPAEEHLFEILFQRAERAILPGHWEVDFRGIPMLDTVFSTNDDDDDGSRINGLSRSIVYSRSGNDFQATMALLRLIDLTSSVRTTIQSGLHQKASSLIKSALDRYLSWAAQDGGYAHLRYVPNIITAELDPRLGETEITNLMEQRMRALAFLQREYLRVDRDDEDFMPSEGQEHCPAALVDRFLGQATAHHAGYAPSWGDDDDDGEAAAAVVYRREPPIVYGLFVLRSSVFLLTVDSAKGLDAYVSFHVDMHFMDRHQSVWNALTIAIAVCLARDQLAARVEDFEESQRGEGSESD
ncbi:hypothetical protein E4U57_007313 [Claviceps arundinis]|uniref:Uncharacterized protein n=1 Tax=Claviceps arundinis TaxID=1623583 RepID=A0A9P7MSZ8_9HYPO|nr:hypothetical protein E4U57_007313 [Claviceps arundinis]KAG5966830.1 hypothetical protein E4U56_001175 [Claviceps arundinis]